MTSTILVASESTLKAATEHLQSADPHLAPIIAHAGLPTFRPHTNYYQALVGSIISQQLSVKAAATIERRFCELFASQAVGQEPVIPQPELIVTKTVEELRTAGLSRAKASYVLDLAEHVIDGRVHFDHFSSLSNDEIIAELVPIKGIGIWTVHMFLIFCMGRMDVLAVGDLGVRNAAVKTYSLTALPDPKTMQELAIQYQWHPYESAVCWYLWHSLDNAPKIA